MTPIIQSTQSKFSPSLQRRFGLLTLTLTAAAWMSGCANLSSSTSVSSAIAGARFQGTVHGGQQPVANSRIRLYVAGSTGYGSAYTYTTGTDLLGSNVVQTNTTGGFTITGDYTCPSSSSLVYLIASGGSPIAGQPANANLAILAALGPCGALTPQTSINMNELTTVAAVYALAPFMTGPTNIGSTPGNLTGITNAFATFNKLVTLSSGTVPGPQLPAGASLPTSELDTLADIISTCVNSTGGSANGVTSDGSLCGNLFALTNNSAGVAPTDTITATLNIVNNPAQNVSALNGLPNSQAPFQPTLGNTPPTAWTVAITYAPTGLNAPAALAADQAGNIWIANGGAKSIVKLTPTGSASGSYAVGQAGSGVLAIDQSGDAWFPSTTSGTLLEATAGGTTNTYTGGGLGVGNAVSIDTSGQVWVTSSNGVSIFASNGVPVTTTAYAAGSNPVAVVISPK